MKWHAAALACAFPQIPNSLFLRAGLSKWWWGKGNWGECSRTIILCALSLCLSAVSCLGGPGRASIAVLGSGGACVSCNCAVCGFVHWPKALETNHGSSLWITSSPSSSSPVSQSVSQRAVCRTRKGVRSASTSSRRATTTTAARLVDGCVSEWGRWEKAHVREDFYYTAHTVWWVALTPLPLPLYKHTYKCTDLLTVCY